jgi:hypothetical protein
MKLRLYFKGKTRRRGGKNGEEEKTGKKKK